jgi:DNA-binding beta-propeller fold protein YncE
MKGRIFTIALVLILPLTLAGMGFGVGYIRFIGEIGRKAAGEGGFGPEISIAFDLNGDIYVSDLHNRTIQKLDRQGRPILTISGDVLNKPGDICVDGAGNIFVADTGAYPLDESSSPPVYLFSPCVLKFSPEGKLTDRIFVDRLKGRPNRVLPARAIITEKGRYALGVQPEGYDRKVLLAADGKGNLFVLDPENSRIYKFDPSGDKLLEFGRYGGGDGEMDDPADIAVSPDGEVIVADKGNHRVIRFSGDGKFLGAFGGKGLGKGEMINPSYLAVSSTGGILVRDSARWRRLIMTRKDLLSVLIQSIIFEGGSTYDAVSRTETLRTILNEMEDRELTLIDQAEGDEKQDEKKRREEERLAQKSIAYAVIERIQRFTSEGKLRDEVIYRIDRRDERLHDLEFAAVDPFGNIYLLDKSDHVLRRYEIEGFTLKRENLDGLLTLGGTNSEQKYIEDYQDINEKPDLDDTHNIFGAHQDLFMRYDISARLNLSLRDILRYSELDTRYITPSRLEDSYTTDTRGVDNFFGTNLQWVLNPNPYRYKELNLYFQHVLGSSTGGMEAEFKDVNRQKSEIEGEASSYLFGVDWDILRNLNLNLEYIRLNPGQTSRNYTRRYYDVSGDLFEVMRSQNASSIYRGEIRLKF